MIKGAIILAMLVGIGEILNREEGWREKKGRKWKEEINILGERENLR